MVRSPSGLVVGLTGGLGSGKSTAAAMFAALGATVLSSDEMGRELMEPGTAVFDSIVERFGAAVLRDGRLDRGELARLAFAGGRVEELNHIVHPAVIARQLSRSAEIFAQQPNAIVIVESALIFETAHGGGWRDRFDLLILVTAPDALKVERFVLRSLSGPQGTDAEALRREARRRLLRMVPDAAKAPECRFVLRNDGSLEHLRYGVQAVWQALTQAPAATSPPASLCP